MKKKDLSGYRIWFWGNLLFTFLLIVVVSWCATSDSLWFDEVFSLNLVDHTWTEMIELAKADVHPPLYYFILKSMMSVWKNLGIDAVFIGKITSLIPVVLMLIWLSNKMAKRDGVLAAALFNICVVGMPNLLSYSVEIRGYSWAMFFVTAAFMYAGDVIAENNTKKAWVLFTVFSVLAAYTHYFSCVAAAIIYLGVLIYKFHDKKVMRKWGISVLLCCLAYVPWLRVFCRQFGTVLGDYWIGEITVNSLYSYFRFLFEPPIAKLHVDVILGIALAASCAFLICCVIKKRSEKKEYWNLWGCAVLVLTVLFGIVVSMLSRPVFVHRYMIVASGCFWLCFAWIIAAQSREKKAVLCGMGGLILLISLIDVGQFVRWEEIRREYLEELSSVLVEIDKADVVFTDGEHMQGCLAYYLNRETEEISPEDAEQFIETQKENNTRIWCFYEKNHLDTIEKLSDTYTVESLGEYHLEYYNFYIFCIE